MFFECYQWKSLPTNYLQPGDIINLKGKLSVTITLCWLDFFFAPAARYSNCLIMKMQSGIPRRLFCCMVSVRMCRKAWKALGVVPDNRFLPRPTAAPFLPSWHFLVRSAFLSATSEQFKLTSRLFHGGRELGLSVFTNLTHTHSRRITAVYESWGFGDANFGAISGTLSLTYVALSACTASQSNKSTENGHRQPVTQLVHAL